MWQFISFPINKYAMIICKQGIIKYNFNKIYKMHIMNNLRD